MSVRKRTWTTKKGVTKHAFVLDYVDQKGKRHIETYRTEREANARKLVVGVGVKEGTHTAHSESITVDEAGANWLANGKATPLERSTLVEYEQVLTLHILPYLGKVKLSKSSQRRTSSPSVIDSAANRVRAAKSDRLN